MKHLLAYLFIVLGLGLLINISNIQNSYSETLKFKDLTTKSNNTNVGNEKLVSFCDNTNSNRSITFFISKRKNCRTGSHNFWSSERVTENEYIKKVIRITKKSKKDKYFIKRVNKLITEYEVLNLDITKLELVKTLPIDELLVQLDTKILIVENKDTNIIVNAKRNKKGQLLFFCDNTSTNSKTVNYFITPIGCRTGTNSYWDSKIISENEYIKKVLFLRKNTKKNNRFNMNVNRLIDLYEALNLDITKLELVKTLPIDELLVQLNNNTQIKEKNLTLVVKEKIKKKVIVTKVEEPVKELFEPKKIIEDNEAPIIEIAESLTVNDSSYEFTGKVSDKATIVYVEVDGTLVNVNEGIFTVKGYSPVNKQISIEAIDQWGNRSKPKIVKLIIDIKVTSVAMKLEPLNPSKIISESSDNKVALIIGIENYLESPNATYANLDAKYFFDYARKAFGVKKQNINLLVDEQATFVKTNKVFTKWLRSKIKSGETELIIFFAGHGLASSDGKELYLLPQDSDPDLLAKTALSRTELFKEIISLNPKNVTMFLDTCYSGVSRDEKTLLVSARPVRIVVDEQITPDNFTIFSASQSDQISSGLKEAKHGIFSYYLMKGLEGKADANNDKDITNGELLAYMDQNVAQKASELGRQQNPSLAGDPDKILMSYR